MRHDPRGGRMQEQAGDNVHIAHADEEAHDDAELMHRIAVGDQEAFQRLMRRHLARTVRLAARVLGSTAAAEDVAQEAFLRVWNHAARWKDPTQAGARFSTWLYRIVLNLCIDEKRKGKFTVVEPDFEILDEKPDAEAGMERHEQSQRVQHALDALPERQRAAFVLCFYEEHSNKEAAGMLGIGVKALEALLVRARRTLRSSLSGEGG